MERPDSMGDYNYFDASNWPAVQVREGLRWGEMRDWVNDNVTSPYYWNPLGIKIEDEKEALMFKLKFG